MVYWLNGSLNELKRGVGESVKGREILNRSPTACLSTAVSLTLCFISSTSDTHPTTQSPRLPVTEAPLSTLHTNEPTIRITDHLD